MANLNCEACEELRELDASFIVNGIQESECASLKNDTGLVPSSGHDNCEDLETMNECLIGNMEATIDMADSCDWRSFVKSFIGNAYEMYKAMLCSMCGIWTNIHNLWTYAKSYRLSGNGHTVILTAEDGEHGRYTVPDNDTTYTLTKNGNDITLRGSDGSTYTVTVTDANTTYTLTKDGNNIVLHGSDGSVYTVAVSDTNTTYTLTKSGNVITLTGSDGQTYNVNLTDNNNKYQLHTKTYESQSLTIAADSAETFDVLVQQPSDFTDKLYPMAVAGWEIEGTNVLRVGVRYIQLVDRSSNNPMVRVVFYNGGSSTASFIFKPEVLWWGADTQS